MRARMARLRRSNSPMEREFSGMTQLSQNCGGPNSSKDSTEVRAVIAQIKEFRKGRKLGKGVTIRELIEHGRRC